MTHQGESSRHSDLTPNEKRIGNQALVKQLNLFFVHERNKEIDDGE
jgi:hypothetical protein